MKAGVVNKELRRASRCARPASMIRLALMLTALAGCAGASSEPTRVPFSPAIHRAVRLQNCVDQSPERGNWILDQQATRELAERIAATRPLVISGEPTLVFSCDVEGLIDHSVAQRGLPFSANITEVRVTLIAWEKPADRIVAVFRGFASVPRGDPDNFDAARRLVTAAVNDVGRQLESWVKGDDDRKGGK